MSGTPAPDHAAMLRENRYLQGLKERQAEPLAEIDPARLEWAILQRSGRAAPIGARITATGIRLPIEPFTSRGLIYLRAAKIRDNLHAIVLDVTADHRPGAIKQKPSGIWSSAKLVKWLELQGWPRGEYELREIGALWFMTKRRV